MASRTRWQKIDRQTDWVEADELEENLAITGGFIGIMRIETKR
jgi:hypothetical protein